MFDFKNTHNRKTGLAEVMETEEEILKHLHRAQDSNFPFSAEGSK
jgi:hypothetical protein